MVYMKTQERRVEYVGTSYYSFFSSSRILGITGYRHLYCYI